MTGLVFFVARAGMIDIGQTVKGQYAIALKAFRLALRSAGRRVIALFVGVIASMRAHAIDESPPTGNELQAGLEEPRDQTMLERLVEIADFPQLFFDVALLDFFGKRTQRFRGGVAGFEGVENCFRREHAAFHRQMDSLESLRIEETARVADDQPAIQIISWHGVPATVGQRFCAVTHKFSAIENFSEERMSLPLLKCGVGIESRIGVFERHHQSDGYAIVR